METESGLERFDWLSSAESLWVQSYDFINFKMRHWRGLELTLLKVLGPLSLIR